MLLELPILGFRADNAAHGEWPRSVARDTPLYGSPTIHPERQSTSLTGRFAQLPLTVAIGSALGDITSSIVPRCAQPRASGS